MPWRVTCLIDAQRSTAGLHITARSILFVVLCLVGFPLRATAQTLDVSAGYAFLYTVGEGDNYNRGWVASVGREVTPRLGIAGEAGCSYSRLGLFGPVFNFSLCNFVGGIRVRSWETRAVTPFAQVLLGGVRFNRSGRGRPSESSYRFAWQPGGGIDLSITRRLGVRVQGDYRFLPIDGHWLGFKEIRLATSITFLMAE